VRAHRLGRDDEAASVQPLLERAQRTEMSIEDVAIAVGFGSADVLRHHFRTRFETSPARYRAGFRASTEVL
jgi:transcriptional regulator GlxA family with amidase domain